MKNKISDEMVYGLKIMLSSKDKTDNTMALDILENRDTEDVDSVKNFESITETLVDKVLTNEWRKNEVWVVKYRGEMIALRSGKSHWDSKGNASKALGHHFSSMFKYNSDVYLKAIISIFKDAKSFRKWLEDKKLIEIVKVG
jgi:hypothetical protein